MSQPITRTDRLLTMGRGSTVMLDIAAIPAGLGENWEQKMFRFIQNQGFLIIHDPASKEPIGTTYVAMDDGAIEFVKEWGILQDRLKQDMFYQFFVPAYKAVEMGEPLPPEKLTHHRSLITKHT